MVNVMIKIPFMLEVRSKNAGAQVLIDIVKGPLVNAIDFTLLRGERAVMNRRIGCD